MALESLLSGRPRPGQALVLAGERNCGKSLLQNLITIMLGGRAAKPYQFMTDRTSFNADLFEAEHLMIEDEQASTDIRARRSFGSAIKQLTAAEVHRCHGKNRPGLSLTPFWRITISVNNEPENLMVLPPLDDSIEDKLLLLKAVKNPMPMPTQTHDQRTAFWNALVQELPAFVHDMMGMEIPDQFKGERYGIVHFHHPEIFEAINSLSPEEKLLTLIDQELFLERAESWTGTADQLERILKTPGSDTEREAEKLLSYYNNCATYLGRLAKKTHSRVSKADRHADHRMWIIEPPTLEERQQEPPPQATPEPEPALATN